MRDGPGGPDEPIAFARDAAAGRRRAATGWKIDPYDGREDYEAVRRFVAEPDAAALIEKLKVADLRGMGGAGVWAHQKWNDVRERPGDAKYVVCNGDESEPAPSRTASCSSARRTSSSRG